MNSNNENVRRTSFMKKYSIIPKLICIAAAFLLWIYVFQMDAVDTESTFYGVTINLENTNVIENEHSLSVYSGYGNLVDVTVMGRKSVIRDYTSEDIRVTADLSEITSPGEYYVKLSANLPNGLTLSGMSAYTVSVYVDESETKTLDVTAKMISGTVAENCELGELVPQYNTVVVTGPKTALDDISEAQIKLDLGAVEGSMSAVGQIELVSAADSSIDMRYLRLSRTEMQVSVPVYTYKEVPLRVDYKYGYLNDSNSKVAISPASVLLKGDPVALAELESLSLAEIDEKSLAGDSFSIFDITPPEGITVADGTENASVNISHVGTVTKIFKIEDFDVIGGEGVNYSFLTEFISVTVRGTLAEIGKITEDKIKATVDISEYTAGVIGTITESVQITISGADVYEIGEYSVQVNIGSNIQY